MKKKTKKPERSTAVIHVRCSPKDHASLKAYAAKSRLKFSTWVLLSLRKEAKLDTR